MNKEGLRFHVLSDFWEAVNEIEQQETRAAAIASQWQEKYDVWCDAIKYGVDPEKMEIYARVAKLKRYYERLMKEGRPLSV